MMTILLGEELRVSRNGKAESCVCRIRQRIFWAKESSSVPFTLPSARGPAPIRGTKILLDNRLGRNQCLCPAASNCRILDGNTRIGNDVVPSRRDCLKRRSLLGPRLNLREIDRIHSGNPRTSLDQSAR